MVRRLVVLRCGDNSLHPEWLSKNANFDIVLSYFGDNIQYDLSHIKYVHHYKGSKWQGLFHFFQNYQDLWKDYDYIWLPDDDLSTNSENINKFFDIINYESFDLAQPALTHNSYYSHALLLQVKGLIYRETNFVEVMAPCFSQKAFQQCWQAFSENKSGWGLDVFWPTLLQNSKIGVIDQTPVFHTRPVGVAGHGMGSEAGTPMHEYDQLMRKYKLEMRYKCISAKLTNGKILKNKLSLLFYILKWSSKDRTSTKQQFKALFKEVLKS